jgi:hypothetical protein
MKNKLMKSFIIKVLNLIRRYLTALKVHCLPTPPSASTYLYKMYVNEEIKKCYETFKPHFQKSIFLDYKNYHKFVIERAKENDVSNKKFYLEFGVYKGTSINFFSKYVNTIYGFDSFEGLREDWAGTGVPKGTFNLNKKLPKLNKNVIPVIGWVQDTLDPFLDKYKPEINFVHLDLDTYESTKFVLTKIKPYLTKNCVIAFDEIYNYPGWEVGEYKALKETFNNSEYKHVCFARNGLQAMIQVI